MAFGFLKKIVSALTGRKSAKPADNGGKKKNRRGGKGRGKGGDKAQQQGQRQKSAQQKPQQKKERGRRPERGDRGERRDRGGRNGRRGPAPVNTAANEMRPGGEISAAELEARKVAHAKWDPATFVVEPQEG